MPSVSLGDLEACFQNNSNTEERLEGLNKLNSALGIDYQESITIIKQLGLNKIFRCLSFGDEEQVEMVSAILALYFNNCPPGEMLDNYLPYLMYMLRHTHQSAKLMALNEVHKALPEIKSPADKYRDVFVAVAHLIADDNCSLNCQAIKIVSNAPVELCPRILEEIKIFLEYDDTSVKCNTFQVACNISLKSPDLMNLCGTLGYIKFMLEELKKPDVLYQMNIMQILTEMAAPAHGIVYLVEHGVLAEIAEFTEIIATNSDDELLLAGTLKFFGSIAHVYPEEMFKKYPIFLTILFKIIQNPNSLIGTALDTLGHIGSRIEGKLSLAALGSVYTSAITRAGELIRSSGSEVKLCALQCLAGLIGYDKDPTVLPNVPIDHRVTLMTREWFRSMSTNPPPMELLFSMCRNPFPDIRLGAYSLLDATCQHHWAEELIAQTPGFIEYLLDRLLDYTKESKEVKFEVIKKLASSTAFDPTIIERLKKYAEDGPFSTEFNVEIAMEDEAFN